MSSNTHFSFSHSCGLALCLGFQAYRFPNNKGKGFYGLVNGVKRGNVRFTSSSASSGSFPRFRSHFINKNLFFHFVLLLKIFSFIIFYLLFSFSIFHLFVYYWFTDLLSSTKFFWFSSVHNSLILTDLRLH